MTIKVEKEYEAEIERLQGALRMIAAMDPWGVRADDLGRAARIARDTLAVPPADHSPAEK